uniref:Uncharacterized protein n=1 Tax=Oryza glumipatula TaxID=40148 RepID=A0A0E0BIM0_9ORYZ
MPVLEGHAVVPHVHRLRTWLSAASGCGLLRDATVGCEDSTIKCTMTQFEDQFSTIKPDGIQVRCHKVLVFFFVALDFGQLCLMLSLKLLPMFSNVNAVPCGGLLESTKFCLLMYYKIHIYIMPLGYM